MKPSGIEWIGDIPDDWEVRKITTLLDNIGSGTTPPNNTDFYENGIIPWLNTGDLTDNYVDLIENKITEYALNQYSALKIFPKDSVVIAMYGATIGKLGILRESASTNQACCVMQCNDNLYFKFLFYSLYGYREYILTLSYGSGQPNISQKIIKDLRLPTPPLKTQQRIADYLDEKCGEIDATIAKQKEIIEKLKAYKQSLISETVTKGLDKSAPLKPSGIKWLGEISQNARIIRLRFLSSIQTGDKDTANRVENGKYPFYVRSPIVERIDTFSFDGEAILMAGDGVGAGKVFHYVNGKFDYHQRVYNIHNLKGVLGKFLYYYLRENFYKEIEQSNAKSTVDSIRLPMLLDFPIIVYLYDLQKKIVSFLDKKVTEIDVIIIKKQNIIQKLDAYKKSLIFEYVTGKRLV